MNRLGILQVFSFVLYVLVQVIFLKDIAIQGVAFCFVYVAYILLLPVETNPLALLAIGFGMGFLMDLFYDSPGLHASACVLVAFLRKFWLATNTPQGGYDAGAVPSLATGGTQWFLVYSIPLIFIHHVTLFFVEIGGFGLFWFTLGKALASTVFTASVIVIMQYLSTRKQH
jgi:hypothetical protein